MSFHHRGTENTEGITEKHQQQFVLFSMSSVFSVLCGKKDDA
jgi:hypothetical protein